MKNDLSPFIITAREILGDVHATYADVPAMFRGRVVAAVQPIEFKLLQLITDLERANRGNPT